MSVYRHRGRWRYDFEFGSQRHQGYCVLDARTGKEAGTKGEARECEALVKREVRQHAPARRPIATSDGFSIGRAMAAHIASQVDSTPLHVANLALYSREILGYFGPDTPVVEIGQQWVDAFRAEAAKVRATVWKGGPRKRAEMTPTQVARYTATLDRQRSASSTNHVLNCLRGAFSAAHRIRDPITGDPLLPHPPEVKPVETSKRLPRPMPDAELYARLAVAPPWVVDAAELARHFGLRRAEALAVTWHHIDREHRALRFGEGETKSGREEFAVPIAGGWELLLRLERQAKARGVIHLVAWPGPSFRAAFLAGEKVPREEWRPLKSIRNAWRKTALKAKVDRPHRLHDTRARYITEVAKVSRGLAKDAARHADPATTERYIAVAASELAKSVKSVPGPKKPAQRRAHGKR